MPAFKTEHLAASALLLILLTLFLPQFAQLMFGFARVFFEGYSLAKVLLFLAWILLVAVVAWVRLRQSPAPAPAPSQPLVWPMMVLYGFGIALGLLLTLWLVSLHGGAGADAVGVLIEHNSQMEWEATYLWHPHVGKVALAPFTDLIPLKGDFGLPLYSILPFREVFALLFLLLLAGMAWFAVRESLYVVQQAHGQVTARLLCWLLASFGLMVTLLDGGILTPAGQIAIGLFFFYIIWFRQFVRARHYVALTLSLLAMGGTVYLVSFILHIGFSAMHSVAAVVLVASAVFAGSRQVNSYSRTIYGIVLLLSLLFLIGTVAIPETKAYGLEQKPQHFLLYGLNPETTEGEVQTALQDSMQVQSLSKTGYLALVTAVPEANQRLDLLEQRLREKLFPRGYFYVVPLSNELHLIKVQTSGNDALLHSCNSAWVQYSEKDGITYAATYADWIYTNLYTLNCLHEQGIESPVVVTSPY